MIIIIIVEFVFLIYLPASTLNLRVFVRSVLTLRNDQRIKKVVVATC